MVPLDLQHLVGLAGAYGLLVSLLYPVDPGLGGPGGLCSYQQRLARPKADHWPGERGEGHTGLCLGSPGWLSAARLADHESIGDEPGQPGSARLLGRYSFLGGQVAPNKSRAA